MKSYQKTLMLAAIVALVVGFIARDTLLQSLGELMVVDDPLQPADVAIMTSETELAGVIELADLFAQHVINRVGALIPEPSLARSELTRRGVTTDSPDRILAALGVPPSAIVLIPAGEGGTTDATEALAKWCVEHRFRRVVVVSTPEHARRMRRALRRPFRHGGPEVRVHTVRYDPFRPLDWWRNRRTLRAGVVELEKLLLDYVEHPLQ